MPLKAKAQEKRWGLIFIPCCLELCAPPWCSWVGCISCVEKPKRQRDDCKLLTSLPLLLVLANTQTLPLFWVRGFVKKVKVRICHYQRRRFKSPAFLTERLAGTLEVTNEAALENNETKQQLFPQPSQLSSLGALKKCSYDTLSHADLRHWLEIPEFEWC